MINTIKFVRKPLYVDAVKVTAENFAEIANWCQGEIYTADGNDTRLVDGADDINPAALYIRVRVHNPKSPRQTKAYTGDWILYTDRGYKVYTEKAFFASFEEIDNDVNPDQEMLSVDEVQDLVI